MSLARPTSWVDFSPRALQALDELGEQYPWSEQQWSELVLTGAPLFVWCTQELAALALYQLSALEELAHLLKIVVHPTLRGSGLAERFMREQCVALRSEGFKRIYLEVAATNLRAQSFYQRLGFKELRRIKGFYRDGVDAITMELAI